MMQLHTEQIGFSYGQRMILNGITLTLSSVGITALVGANGVGKTVLMKMLAGLLAPTQGAVHLITPNGALNPSQHAQGRRHLGFHSDTLHFWQGETVQEAITLTQALRQVAQPQLEYDLLVEQCHLGDLQRVVLKQLSLGQQRRVGLALALVGKPAFIFLDEPTNALDLKEQETTMALVKRLAQHSHLIITSHRFNEVDALANRLLILKEGRLCHDAPLTMPVAEIYRVYYHDAL